MGRATSAEDEGARVTGLIYAAAPLVAACLVARRERTHQPVTLALGASALYSVAALPALASHLDPRALLGLFALVAVASGQAYARAFGWRWTELNVTRLGWALIVVAGALALVWPRASLWDVATWGPFVVSSVVGGLAVWAWWRSREWRVMAYWAGRGPGDGKAREHDLLSTTIAQRCALVLLASDVCMLAFVRWPGVQAWQGRAAALAVTIVQVAWLVRRGTRPAP